MKANNEYANNRAGIEGFFRKRPYMPFIAPALIVIAVLVIFPTIFLYFISATNYEMATSFSKIKIVWFDNYIRLFSGADKDFWNSVYVSFKLTVLATSIEMIAGFIIAYMLNREFRGKAIIFACLIVPIAMTPSIAGLIWKLMLNSEYGIINYILNSLFGIKVTWLDKTMAFRSVVMVDVWQNTPFVALIIYAGMRSIPTEPYESAKIDGANAFQLLTRITIPLLKPILWLALLFRCIDSLRMFDVPFALTQGGPGNATETMSMHIYRLGFAQTGWIARAGAMAIILILLSSLVSTVFTRRMRKED